MLAYLHGMYNKIIIIHILRPRDTEYYQEGPPRHGVLNQEVVILAYWLRLLPRCCPI